MCTAADSRDHDIAAFSLSIAQASLCIFPKYKYAIVSCLICCSFCMKPTNFVYHRDIKIESGSMIMIAIQISTALLALIASMNLGKTIIFDFPRKRRCVYFTLSFTHLLELKHQWFTVLNTCRI